MALIKKLTKIGNSWGIILPSDILQLLGWNKNTGEMEVEISVRKDQVILKPVQAEDQEVMEAMTRFTNKYREDLKKLA